MGTLCCALFTHASKRAQLWLRGLHSEHCTKCGRQTKIVDSKCVAYVAVMFTTISCRVRPAELLLLLLHARSFGLLKALRCVRSRLLLNGGVGRWQCVCVCVINCQRADSLSDWMTDWLKRPTLGILSALFEFKCDQCAGVFRPLECCCCSFGASSASYEIKSILEGV